MKHGNILALFNADATTITTVEAIVAAHATKYKLLGQLFYIETPDIVTAQKMVTALKKTTVEFVFYYNNISNGSTVNANTGNPNLAAIKKIML